MSKTWDCPPRHSPYSPRSNGLVEHKKRALMDMVNAMLTNSSAPESLCGEALLTSCSIINKIPFKHSDKTPYELWKKRVPGLEYLRMWGCLAKIAIPKPRKEKIRPKIVDDIFIGFVSYSGANRF